MLSAHFLLYLAHMKYKRALQDIRYTFLKIIKNPWNDILLIFLSLLIFITLKIIPVYTLIRDFFKVSGTSFLRKLEVVNEFTFLSCTDSLWETRIVTVLLSVLIAFNILLFMLYAKRQGTFLRGSHKSMLATLGGIILGFFGIGCISCGAFILAPLITFLGLGSYMHFFTGEAHIISFIGVLFVFLSNLYLLRQLSKPIVCSVA